MTAPRPNLSIRPLEQPDSTERLGELADLAAAAARAAALGAVQRTAAPEPADEPTKLSESWRQKWPALLVSSCALGVLTLLGTMFAASIVPAAFGWHPAVVMSDSMAPRLLAGDVVVARPVPADRLVVGMVLLVADPDHPGRLRLHRLAAVRPDGQLTLRGDANRAADSTPVARVTVRGVGALRLPYIGSPMIWLNTHSYLPLGIVGVILAALFAALGVYRPREGDDDQSRSATLDPATAEADRTPHPIRHRSPDRGRAVRRERGCRHGSR